MELKLQVAKLQTQFVEAERNKALKQIADKNVEIKKLKKKIEEKDNIIQKENKIKQKEREIEMMKRGYNDQMDITKKQATRQKQFDKDKRDHEHAQKQTKT